MIRSGFNRLVTGLVLVVCLAACAAPGGPPVARSSGAPEVDAASHFLRGQMLELDGKLVDAAAAYDAALAADPDSAELHRRAAQVWARMGEAEQALGYAQRAYALDPDDEKTRSGLAMLLVAAKRYGEAVELMKPRFEAGELSQDAMFALFNLYMEMGELAEAQGVAQRMVELAPLEARPHFALGLAFERQNRNDEARAAYRRGIAELPGEPRFFDALARLAQREEDPQGEMEVLEQKLRAFPGDVASLRRMAQIEEDAGNRAGAIEILETLVARSPDQLAAQFQLGFFYFEAERFPDAIERFSAVIARSDGLADRRWVDEVRYFTGRAHYSNDDTPGALEALGEIEPGSDRYADARIVMARIHEEDGDVAAALAEVRRSAAAVPDNTAVQTYLAGLLQRSGDVDGAIDLMQKLVASAPDDAELYYDLGVIYGNAGRESQAIEQMVLVLEHDADHASALNYLGYSWAESGERLDEAEAYIRRAVEQRPDDGYIADSLGWVFYQKGLKSLAEGDAARARSAFDQAIEQLERALGLLEEGDPVITRHLADAYRSVSRFTDALATYRRALELDPEEDDAHEIRQQIELLEAQLQGNASRLAR